MNTQTEILQIVNLVMLVNATGKKTLDFNYSGYGSMVIVSEIHRPDPKLGLEMGIGKQFMAHHRHGDALPKLRKIRHDLEVLLAECEREQAEQGQERAA